MKILLFILILKGAFADVSKEVFIKGKIGSSFNDNQVKVTDSLGQIYYLPRKVFPTDFKFRQGAPFFVEVNEDDLHKIKMIIKK